MKKLYPLDSVKNLEDFFLKEEDALGVITRKKLDEMLVQAHEIGRAKGEKSADSWGNEVIRQMMDENLPWN